MTNEGVHVYRKRSSRTDAGAARGAHRRDTQIAQAHEIAIQCMAGSDQLPPTGTTLVLGPLQLQDGSGSPLSVIAFVP